MVWRGNLTKVDRLWGGLVYLLPMARVVVFGLFLLARLPFLRDIFAPILALAQILAYPIIPQLIDVDFVVFICLYILVVRDSRVKHFIRFSTMQALLISIALTLLLLVVDLTGTTGIFDFVPGSLLFYLIELLASTLFIGVNAITIYGIIQAILGKYAEIPVISTAAYSQVDY